MGMDEALAEDRAARGDPHAWMIARFVCPVSRLEELRDHLGGWEAAPALSVVFDGLQPADEATWSEGLRADAAEAAAAREAGAPVEALELVLPSPRPGSAALLAAQTALLQLRVEKYLELVPGENWRDTLPAAVGAAAAVGARVKLRCGGPTAGSFPPPDLVALVIASCRHAGVVFKATAGLHHPVRHTDPQTGFPMHGFLNFLAASAFAAAHGSGRQHARTGAGRGGSGALRVGPDRIEAEGLRASTAQIAAARRHLFAGYGSCSWREPVADLQELGVLR